MKKIPFQRQKPTSAERKINLSRTIFQSQPNDFSFCGRIFTDSNPCKTNIYMFSKNIQPLRHEKMDGHIRIQMQKYRMPEKLET